MVCSYNSTAFVFIESLKAISLFCNFNMPELKGILAGYSVCHARHQLLKYIRHQSQLLLFCILL